MDRQLKADSKSGHVFMGAVGYPVRALATTWAPRYVRWGHVLLLHLANASLGSSPPAQTTLVPEMHPHSHNSQSFM